MPGGYKKIHEHPNAGKSTFRERPEDINKKGKDTGPHLSTMLKNLLELPIEQVVPVIEEHCKGKSLKEATAIQLIVMAMHPDTPHNVKLSALREIWDRTEGKAQQNVQLGEDRSNPFGMGPTSGIQVLPTDFTEADDE